MANRNFASSKMFTGHVMPVLIDCNFIVDPYNGNGLGIRSLKGPYVANVYMQQLTQSVGPPPGSPNLLTAASYAVLASSTITNTGSSVLTGDLGLFPGTSVTGFPPGTVSGTENITNAAANQAQIDATAAFVNMNARSSTTIASILDGQTLSAGVYSFLSGSASLAASGNGTLTLNGSATDVFIIKTASTLTTGAGGTPTIALTGGALASNVYWAIGSSATLNVSGSGTFVGQLIAQTSATVDGGTVNGSLMALSGAVTISAATAITVQTGSLAPVHVAGTPQPGVIVVQLQDNFNKLYTGGHAIVSPVSLLPLQIDNSALTPGVAYTITTLGADDISVWIALGMPRGLVPAVGLSFIAANNGGSANVSSSRVMAAALGGSGVASIETVGDSNLALAPNPALQSFGSQIILEARDYTNTIAAPVAGSVISLSFLLSNSSVLVNGE